MKSVLTHDFSKVPQANIPRSVFDRTHAHKTTFDAGYLIPFYVDEALPGDTFNLKATILARLNNPLVKPVMDNMHLDIFYFAVPLRLLWTNFQRFMGERDPDPDSSTDYTVPQVTTPEEDHWDVGSLFDYFGLPTEIEDLSVSAFWSRAYNFIWNEWFRDENLQDSVTVDKDNGPDDPADYVLLKRGKRHDYFTSCLPWPQIGDAVEISLGDSTQAPIVGLGGGNTNLDNSDGTAYETDNAVGQTYARYKNFNSGSADNKMLAEIDAATGLPMIYATLDGVGVVNINDLREAFQLQVMAERDARGGTRYTEIIRSHFGVVSPDARLQRPEFLGGSHESVIVTPVPQTSESDTTNQGTLAGYATCATNNAGFTKSFTEHCVVMGLLCAYADLTYQQGIPRMFSRLTKYDYYWPSLAHLGEQEVLNKEIYAQGTEDDDEVFGYQERYAEYRYFPSKITGALRSTYATSLDVWHLSQEFDALPTLSDAFIAEEPPIDRIVGVPSEPHFIMDSFIQIRAVRPMPTYGVPGLIDHF